MNLQRGMRVRCVDNVGSRSLRKGAEYTISDVEFDVFENAHYVHLLENEGCWWASRFEHVARVKLQPGMRVRYVGAKAGGFLQRGPDYTVQYSDGDFVALRGCQYAVSTNDLKPVVRVKAPCVPLLEVLTARAIAAVAAMSPHQQAAHWAAQRDSWVRGNAGID